MNSNVSSPAALLRLVALLLSAPALLGQPRPAGPLPPTDLPGLRYTNEFFPGASYRASVPTPESVLGFPIGQRAANAAEIERCLKAWAGAAPDRVRLVEYARSHENRPLYYMVVTSPANVARLDGIQADLARLGDARKTSEADATELIKSLPAVGWLGYTIHGDETEGSDAALAILHHLIASGDSGVEKLLNEVVVIIDPLMNPDGRDRFLKMVAEHRGAMPNVDDQSLLHEGYWPYGRGNHYLFDLNRDMIYGVHPESRGRIREIGRWNPQMFVDAHGMGAQDTHLFSPPREPINPNMPVGKMRWSALFAKDQADAFDRHHLLYYHGEWNEEWFPGYTDGWASYRGAIGILYEQARIAEDGVRRPEGRILSYRESLQHHIIGSMANLATLQSNAKQVLQSFYSTRKTAVDANGPYAHRTFAVLPSANGSRLRDFLTLMRLQGFEIFRAATEFTVPSAIDQLGRETKQRTLPAGTILIPNRQPLAHLLAAMLEFDPRISPAALADERQELLRKGQSRIYDTTAWNLTMFQGLDALTLAMELPEAAQPYQAAPAAPSGITGNADAAVAFVIDGADDLSVAAAARLMERGVEVRVAEKPFQFDAHDFARGSVLITRLDNRTFAQDLLETVSKTARELGLNAVAVTTGLGPGDVPDLGGMYFHRLLPPQIALAARGGADFTDYGSIWFVLDHHLGIRHSHVQMGDGLDLSRYNVLIMPEGASGTLSPGLRDWVKAGGTLIAIGSSVNSLINEKAEFSKVRRLPEVLAKLGDYELVLFREWMARYGEMPASESIWAHKPGTALQYPWQTLEGGHPEEKELKKRDGWQALFMPQGAIVAGRADTNHWITFGCGELLPVMVGRQPVLMSGDGVEAPVRLGYLTALDKPSSTTNAPDAKAKTEPAGEKKDSDKKDKKEPPRIGWAALPEGYEMHLRLSGLLWPEAAQRLANAAQVTREAFGRGQIILFAMPPTFRASERATLRLFSNALIYGPGCGAAQPIKP